MMEVPEVMRAVLYRDGSPVVEDVPVPKPSRDQVLIKVAAAGMNRADIMQRMGHYDPPRGASKIPGLEVSGKVVRGGEHFSVGKSVCALLEGGGYAEYVVVSAGQVLPIPEGMSLVNAGGIMEVAATVISNLDDTVRVRGGQWVLVHGGSGGIGTFALQFLKLVGARTIATASSSQKCDWALRHGADHAINYREQDFVEAVNQITANVGVDVILDVVGAKYLKQNVDALADGGRLVVIGLQGGVSAQLNLGELLAKRAGIIATALRSRSAADKAGIVSRVHEVVWPALREGTIVTRVDEVFPLERVLEAQQYFNSGQHVGKVILVP